MNLRACFRVFVAALVVHAALWGCEEQPELVPYFEIVAREVRVHSFGSPNYHLVLSMRHRFHSGDGTFEIVESSEPSHHQSYTFTGTSTVYMDMGLVDTSIINGDLVELQNIKERAAIIPPRRFEFGDEREATLIEYTGVDGKPRKYVLRLRPRHPGDTASVMSD